MVFLCIPLLFSLFLLLFMMLLFEPTRGKKKKLTCVRLPGTSHTSGRKELFVYCCFSSKLEVFQQGDR